MYNFQKILYINLFDRILLLVLINQLYIDQLLKLIFDRNRKQKELNELHENVNTIKVQ